MDQGIKYLKYFVIVIQIKVTVDIYRNVPLIILKFDIFNFSRKGHIFLKDFVLPYIVCDMTEICTMPIN